MLAMMSPASRSLLPRVCPNRAALASSSALIVASLVIADIILLYQISSRPVAIIATVGRANGSGSSTCRYSRPPGEREGEETWPHLRSSSAAPLLESRDWCGPALIAGGTVVRQEPVYSLSRRQPLVQDFEQKGLLFW